MMKKEKNMELPNKKYKIIYADPPWQYKDKLNLQKEGSSVNYNVMSFEELTRLKPFIDDLTDKDCILFMWVTMPKLQEGLKVIENWGFTYKTCGFCWIKQNPKAKTIFNGLGRWVMGNAELCYFQQKVNHTE